MVLLHGPGMCLQQMACVKELRYFTVALYSRWSVEYEQLLPSKQESLSSEMDIEAKITGSIPKLSSWVISESLNLVKQLRSDNSTHEWTACDESSTFAFTVRRCLTTLMS